jgi:hypothetical protein
MAISSGGRRERGDTPIAARDANRLNDVDAKLSDRFKQLTIDEIDAGIAAVLARPVKPLVVDLHLDDGCLTCG